MDIQRPALLASAALCVMHLQLYWASVRTQVALGRWSVDQGLPDMHCLLKHWASVYTGASVMCNRNSLEHRDPKCPPEAFDILTCIGNYHHGVMQLTNLGIDLLYDPGVMVSYLGPSSQTWYNVTEGDQIVWAWFLQDSVHNYARTPCLHYAWYNPINLDVYKFVRYNQVDFALYGTP
ncbi:hypothetical protein F4604DRAFT_1591681 [Suillus subluteus]|nr:hypothetical protein F4604DRAFT_1591681 [Suillus subluteus]